MKSKIKEIAAIVLIFGLYGCADILNEKSDSRLVTPTSLNDNQALLDKISNLLASTPISGEISSGDIYVSDDDYNAVSSNADKRLYVWEPDYVSKGTGNDWSACYNKVNTCNTVLFNIENYKIAASDNVKGQALTIRASLYLDAAQIWCLAYKKATAATDLGLPLRLYPDFTIPSVRASLQQTYDLILNDLHQAKSLLPDQQVSVSRASKRTALGFLARTYLYMGDYQNALHYAKEALSIKNELLDYTLLNSSASYPILSMNTEVVLPTTVAYSPILGTNMAKIPASLYNDYESNDLRKLIFFRKNASGEVLFRGNYSGSTTRTSVLATDELYLIAAESYAQLNDLSNAMLLLNKLLITRWKKGTFTPIVAADKADAIKKIEQERRKELVFRGIRWADLKRYNRDGRNILLQRTVNGKLYQLPPNDLRYAIAIPEDIVKMTGIPQNPR